MSGAVSNELVRRAFMGLAMGATAVAIIYSPWGQRSGAHMNPAVTLTFFRLGKVARAGRRRLRHGPIRRRHRRDRRRRRRPARHRLGPLGALRRDPAWTGGRRRGLHRRSGDLLRPDADGPGGVESAPAGAVHGTLRRPAGLDLHHGRSAAVRDEHEPGADVGIGPAGAGLSRPLDLLHRPAARHAAGGRTLHPGPRRCGSSAPSCTIPTPARAFSAAP